MPELQNPLPRGHANANGTGHLSNAMTPLFRATMMDRAHGLPPVRSSDVSNLHVIMPICTWEIQKFGDQTIFIGAISSSSASGLGDVTVLGSSKLVG